MLVARALPAGLGAAAKCKRYSLTGPNRQLDRTRIELLCCGGTADPSAVLAACMHRNVFGLLARAARIKGNDLFRELGDASFISKFTGDGGSFSRDAPPK